MPDKLVEKLSKMKPGGGSSLYDAIYMACMHRQLVDGEPYDPRRVLIVIGDGHDNASKKSLDEVIEIAQRNLVTIYGMSTVSFGFTSEGDENLQRLTSETGGRVVYPLNNLYSDVDGYLSHPSDDGNYALTVGMGAYASEVSDRDFPRHRGHCGRGDHAVHSALRAGHGAGECEAVPQYQDRGAGIAAAKVRFRKGYYPFAP